MAISLSGFADKLNEVMPVIIKEFSRYQANELYKGKITLPQFLIMDFLNKKGEARMTDLAHFMGVSTAAVTGIVDRLVKYGYVLRGFEPEDRRVIKIKLTPKGYMLVKKINLQRREMLINVFGKISDVDRQEYLRILMEIKDVLMK